MFNQLGLIGCGLMGGSFALALKKARRLGVIDVAAESALLAVSGSDIVLVAVPVAATEATFKAIRHLVDPNMLVMDVGSTKRDVVDAARRVLKERLPSFVPAHPIAGKEVAGIEHADATLYQGRKTILTPLMQTDPRQLQKATDVWAAVGCQVLKMTPEHHDEAFAAVSHLPHLLAFAYMNSLNGQSRGTEYLSLAGPGFRDFSRIAASDPTIWRDILLSNREEVLRQSEAFRLSLEALERQMRDWNGSALQNLIQQASDGRAGWQLGAPVPAAPPKTNGSR